MTCPGPLIWRNADQFDDSQGAVLDCAADGCDYVIVTGQFHEARHASTHIIRERLVT